MQTTPKCAICGKPGTLVCLQCGATSGQTAPKDSELPVGVFYCKEHACHHFSSRQLEDDSASPRDPGIDTHEPSTKKVLTAEHHIEAAFVGLICVVVAAVVTVNTGGTSFGTLALLGILGYFASLWLIYENHPLTKDKREASTRAERTVEEE